MVFCSFRDCVMEIVVSVYQVSARRNLSFEQEMLNDHSDLLRATKFVGQSQGKQEQDKGFNQKEQKKVQQSSFGRLGVVDDQYKTIQEFKEGKFNILVSTSIGEEGLDIGEVDFVVIYDMPKQSIKLVSLSISAVPGRGADHAKAATSRSDRTET